MNDVLAVLDRARLRSAELNDDLAARFALAPGDHPIGGFNIVNHYIVLTMELVSAYSSMWGTPIAFRDDRDRLEKAERIMTITRFAFVLGLSAFEFSAKHAVGGRPGKLVVKGKRSYLSEIIRQSVTAGLIDSAEADSWTGVIDVRNDLVHNNGVADTTSLHNLSGVLSIKRDAGQMTQGNLRFFPELLAWSIDGFGRWSEAFLVAHVG